MRVIIKLLALLFFYYTGYSCQAQETFPPVSTEANTFWSVLEQKTVAVAVDTFENRMDEAYYAWDTLFMQQLLNKTRENYLHIPMWEITYHFWDGLYYMRVEHYEKAAEAFANAVDRSKQHQIDRFLLPAGMNQGFCLERINQTTQAYDLYEMLERLIIEKLEKSRQDSVFLHDIKYKLGYKDYLEDDYVNALIKYQDALMIAQATKDTFNITRVLYHIMYMEDHIGEDTASQVSKSQLLTILESQNTDYSKAKALSIRLEDAKSLEEASTIFKKLESIYQAGKINDITFTTFLYAYSTWLEDNISYTAAYPIYQRIIASYDTDCAKQTSYYYSRIGIIEYYLETKQYTKVPQEVHQVLRCIHDRGDLEAQTNIYNQLSKAYLSLNKPDSAYYYLLQASLLRDSMEAGKNTEKIMKTYLQNQFQQEKALLALEREKEQAAAVAQLKQERTILVSVIIVFILLAGLSVLIYRNYKLETQRSGELTEANQKLELSNQNLDRFASSVSHDILSNLDLIISTGKVLIGHKGELEKLQQFYEETMYSVRQTKQYCMQILTAALPNNDQPSVVTDSNTILEQVLTKLSGDIQQYDIEIKYESLPFIHIQAGDLAQIFQNLLHNAIIFSGPSGDGKIIVQAVVENDNFRLGVLDNGPGIPTNQEQAIFEPGVSFRKKGTGIGLATVKAIVDSYDGQIWAERSDLGGAAVWVQFKKHLYTGISDQ